MLLIPCPWCGKRAETEFLCAGEVRPSRTDMIDSTDESWIEYLCYHDVDQAIVQEYWCHEYGCGEWFLLCRNIVTHEIIESG